MSGSSESPSPTNTWQSLLNTLSKKLYMNANDLGILSKLSRTKTKHCSSSRESIMGTNQILAEVPHLLAEVWSRWPHSRKRSRENLGFPFFEEHEEHGCKDHTLSLQDLRFYAMNSKTWTWAPILEDLMKTNTKAWILMQLSDQTRLLFKNT